MINLYGLDECYNTVIKCHDWVVEMLREDKLVGIIKEYKQI